MGEDTSGKLMYKGGNNLNVWGIINEKNSQTRGKLLWYGKENIKIREEAVKKFLVIFYIHHIDNGWHLTK